jgi:hypothetical protein
MTWRMGRQGGVGNGTAVMPPGPLAEMSHGDVAWSRL